MTNGGWAQIDYAFLRNKAKRTSKSNSGCVRACGARERDVAHG